MLVYIFLWAFQMICKTAAVISAVLTQAAIRLWAAAAARPACRRTSIRGSQPLPSEYCSLLHFINDALYATAAANRDHNENKTVVCSKHENEQNTP